VEGGKKDPEIDSQMSRKT